MSEYKNWRLQTDADNILWCTIDVPGVSLNVLSREVLEEFSGIIDSVESGPPAGMVLLSGKENGFIAGADVREFSHIDSADEALGYVREVHALFRRVEKLPMTTVCAINGVCLGGGLELALSCNYRIAVDNPASRIGLPEVLLGIHPGFGGSVRFIRQTGPLRGLPLMLAGKTVDPRKAKKLGLLDRTVPLRQFHAAAEALIRTRPARARPPLLHRLLNRGPLRTLLAAVIRRGVAKKVRQEHYPAPFALLELWQTHGGNEDAMLAAEAESVAELVSSETSRNLVRVFMLQEQLKASGSASDTVLDSVHVVGAGVMGGDIAAWCASQGMTVTLQDREARFIAPAIQRAARLFKRRLKEKRRITAAMDRLIPDITGDGVPAADVIIEAIVEDVDIKSGLFQDLEPRIKEGAILATNTSSIALESLGKALPDPGRLVGIHFFNPVAMMQLVEVICSTETEQRWIDAASAFCKKINRLPLVVKSSPGFLVNRILSPYMNETMILLEEGVQAELIDRVATDFGMPMGPVELADNVGLDICLSVSKIMTEKLDMHIPDALVKLVEKGHTGRKSGRGFYEYRKGKPLKRDIIATTVDRDVIRDRLVLRIVNESAACLREEIVENADYLDAGMIFGTGFAPFTGGPMHYATQRGRAEVVTRLKELEAGLGARFRPDSYWESSAAGTE